MLSIVLEEKFSPREYQDFSREFPNYHLLVIPNLEESFSSLDSLTRHSIQVYYGNRFPWERLKDFPQIKWIHTKSQIPQEGAPSLVITSSQQLYAAEIAELLWSSFHLFSKKINEIKEGDIQKDNKIWSSHNKTFLQIGLGPIGSSLAFKANNARMKTWGVQSQGSYHEACNKTFSMISLNALLPYCDIVSLSPSKVENDLEPLDTNTLNLIKDDAILMIAGMPIQEIISEKVFKNISWERFRGIIVFPPLLLPNAYRKILKALPNALIIPPDIASYMETKSSDAYRQFRNNLRAFSRSDIIGMQGVIQKGPLKEFFSHLN